MKPEPIQSGAQKPKLIYLQWLGDSNEPPTGREEIRDADVTWSRERIFKHDLVYILPESPAPIPTKSGQPSKGAQLRPWIAHEDTNGWWRIRDSSTGQLIVKDIEEKYAHIIAALPELLQALKTALGCIAGESAEHIWISHKSER